MSGTTIMLTNLRERLKKKFADSDEETSETEETSSGNVEKQGESMTTNSSTVVVVSDSSPQRKKKDDEEEEKRESKTNFSLKNFLKKFDKEKVKEDKENIPEATSHSAHVLIENYQSNIEGKPMPLSEGDDVMVQELENKVSKNFFKIIKVNDLELVLIQFKSSF